MESFYHKRPAPPNVSSILERNTKILASQAVLERRARVTTTSGMSRRSLESSSSRLTKTFSDQIPLCAGEPKIYCLQFEDRHLGKQMNGLMRDNGNLSDLGRETEGIAHFLHPMSRLTAR
jgi:hypothetical protein